METVDKVIVASNAGLADAVQELDTRGGLQVHKVGMEWDWGRSVGQVLRLGLRLHKPRPAVDCLLHWPHLLHNTWA